MSRFTCDFTFNRCCQRVLGSILFSALILYLEAGVTVALIVISTGPQTIKTALGESVTLGCEYMLTPSDIGELDIEWSMVSPDMTQKDRPVLFFTGGKVYKQNTGALAEGVGFAASDPTQGDASLLFSPLVADHTGTYNCKVKKGLGVDTRKVTLVVLERPSVPKCALVGSEKVGSSLSLQCKSSQGSAPLSYRWRKGSDGGLPPNVTQNSVTGELFIASHSQRTQGMYLCEARNAVGVERCRFRLEVIRPPNRAGVVVGTLVGGLLLTVLLLLFIWFLLCQWDKRRSEKDVGNEIRVDTPSPLNRTPSRASGRRSDWAYSSMSKRSMTRSLASGSLPGSLASGRRSPESWLLGARLESRCGFDP